MKRSDDSSNWAVTPCYGTCKIRFRAIHRCGVICFFLAASLLLSSDLRAAGTPQQQTPPSENRSVPLENECPTPEQCNWLKLWAEYYAMKSTAAQAALQQAEADRQADLAKADQLEKQAAVQKSDIRNTAYENTRLTNNELNQAKALRGKLDQAKADAENAAAVAAKAQSLYEDCVKRLRDCPPAKTTIVPGAPKVGMALGWTTLQPRRAYIIVIPPFPPDTSTYYAYDFKTRTWVSNTPSKDSPSFVWSESKNAWVLTTEFFSASSDTTTKKADEKSPQTGNGAGTVPSTGPSTSVNSPNGVKSTENGAHTADTKTGQPGAPQTADPPKPTSKDKDIEPSESTTPGSGAPETEDKDIEPSFRSTPDGLTTIGENIRPGDFTSMDAIVHQYILDADQFYDGWTSKPAPNGAVNYTSPDGKSTIHASFYGGSILVEPDGDDIEPSGLFGTSEVHVSGSGIQPGDYATVDKIVRKTIKSAGSNPDHWTAVSNADGSGVTYTSPDKTREIRAHINDEGSVEYEAFEGPANLGSSDPAPDPPVTPLLLPPFGMSRTNIYGGYSDETGWQQNYKGGEVSFEYNLNAHFGVFGNYSGYESGKDSRSSYLAGPRYQCIHPKWTMFGDAGFGALRSSSPVTTVVVTEEEGSSLGTTSLATRLQTTRGSANTFAMEIGGGFDLNLAHHFALRLAKVDYVLTRFGGKTQDNIQFSTGFVFKF